MQTIPRELMPYWNSTSIGFLTVVAYIVGAAIVVLWVGLLVYTLTRYKKDRDWGETVSSALMFPALGIAVVGLVSMILITVGYMISSLSWEDDRVAEELTKLGYSNVEVTESEFTASLNGEYVEGVLSYKGGKYRVAQVIGPDVE